MPAQRDKKRANEEEAGVEEKGSRQKVMRQYLQRCRGGEVPRGMWGGGEVENDIDGGAGVSETPPENSENMPYNPLAGLPLSNAPAEPLNVSDPHTNTLPAPSPTESIVGPPPASTEAMYDTAASGDKVADAMASQRRADLISGVGRSLQQIFTARATANGLKPDTSAFDAIASQGARDVQQASHARQQAIQDFLAKRQLGRQDVQDTQTAAGEARAQGEYERKPLEAEKGRQERQTELTARLAEKRGDMEMADRYRRDALAQGAQNHQDSVAATQEARSAREASALTGKQDNAFQRASHDIESFRGNSAVQQANSDLLSAGKAMKLVNKPDFTTQDLSLLASEMAKVAQGGVPTEHGVKALMPDDAETKLAQLQNFLSSKPTDAGSREYVARNKEYLQDMLEVAKGTVRDFQGNTLNGYKHLLRPEDYKDLEARHGLAPQDPEVAGYAAQHKISYDEALRVKAARTGGR